jgi:hypothetical protein
MGVRDAKAVTDCKLNIDGESKKLGAAIPRGFLSACGGGRAAAGHEAKRPSPELAQWLTSPQHPLTARVMVNRVWLQLFGEGLVRTPDDFGLSGERPTHPELLDHLATRFMREGWSIKRLIRSIVLSRTYQLSSLCDENSARLIPTIAARSHNRRRLDAETVRDAMLAATGDLNPQPAQRIAHPASRCAHQRAAAAASAEHASQCVPAHAAQFHAARAHALQSAGRHHHHRQTRPATLATQSLYLLNNAFIVGQSKRFASNVQKPLNDTERPVSNSPIAGFARDASEPSCNAPATSFARPTCDARLGAKRRQPTLQRCLGRALSGAARQQ